MSQAQQAFDLTPDVAALAADTLMRWRLQHTGAPDARWARQVFDRWCHEHGLSLVENGQRWPEFQRLLESTP